MLMKVGTLAKRTGLTIRTLHYYEEIGLLVPATRSEKGYRLYGREEVQRLQKILSLQQLGFSLEEIRGLLDHPDFSLPHVLDMHIDHVKSQVKIGEQLLARLEMLSRHLKSSDEISVDEFIQTIEVTVMHEKYYSEEQLETLKQRRETLGDEGMQKAQDQWAELLDAFRDAMANGIDPADESVQALVARSNALIQAFTGGDPGIGKSLQKMYDVEGPEKASQGMVDAALFEYMGKARSAPKK